MLIIVETAMSPAIEGVLNAPRGLANKFLYFCTRRIGRIVDRYLESSRAIIESRFA